MHGTLTGLVTINCSGTWKNKGKIAVLSNERRELMTKVSMGGKFPVFQPEQKREALTEISCLCLSVLSGQNLTKWLNKTFL